MNRFNTARHISPAAIGVELLPCPFCGVADARIYAGPTPHVTCMSCGCDGPLPRGQFGDRDATLAEACTAWNTRPISRPTQVQHVPPRPIDPRPMNCRNRIRDEGKPYPKSGCAACGNGGLMGCPHERKKSE